MSGRNFNLADYATVDERITRYWSLHPKPEGSIQTDIIWVAEDGNSVAIKATVYMGDRILATGIAQEERGKTFKDGANFSSWFENCETSAIGRALANMDLSLSKSSPSRQEMAKVERYEQDPTPRQTNAPRPVQHAQQAPQPATADYTLTDFWRETKQAGYADPQTVATFLGIKTFKGYAPADLLTMFRDKQKQEAAQ